MKRLSHFRFSRSQRSGILFFSACIVILQVLIWKGVFTPDIPLVPVSDPEVERVNGFIDSVLAGAKEPVYTPTPFNPNFMSDHKGYMFGMTPEEIDRLFAFREKGGFIRTKEEFREVTGVHDSVFLQMAPLFRFPRFPETRQKVVAELQKQDINTAAAESLQQVYGIGPVLAERIVAYRERLGGFAVKEQLEEVYGLQKEVVAEVWRHFHLDNPAKITRLDINSADLDALAETPYISMSLASRIVAYRSVHRRLDSLEELTKIHDLSQKDLSRIQLYLKVE